MEKGYTSTPRRGAGRRSRVIAQEASSIKGASNQVAAEGVGDPELPHRADQKPEHVREKLTAFLSANPPWGSEVTVTHLGPAVDWWMTDPNGPAVRGGASPRCARGSTTTRSRSAAAARSGSSVRPLSELFGGRPRRLLMGI